jgi:hypothetical protein
MRDTPPPSTGRPEQRWWCPPRPQADRIRTRRRGAPVGRGSITSRAGSPSKDAGATFIAHMNAKTRLKALKDPDVVIPDIGTGNLHAIELGGTRLELHYVGRNQSDNSLVMLLPK